MFSCCELKARWRSGLVLRDIIIAHDTAIMGSRLDRGNFSLVLFRTLCTGNEAPL